MAIGNDKTPHDVLYESKSRIAVNAGMNLLSSDDAKSASTGKEIISNTLAVNEKRSNMKKLLGDD